VVASTERGSVSVDVPLTPVGVGGGGGGADGDVDTRNDQESDPVLPDAARTEPKESGAQLLRPIWASSEGRGGAAKPSASPTAWPDVRASLDDQPPPASVFPPPSSFSATAPKMTMPLLFSIPLMRNRRRGGVGGGLAVNEGRVNLSVVTFNGTGGRAIEWTVTTLTIRTRMN
jgi:hypothetical protein